MYTIVLCVLLGLAIGFIFSPAPINRSLAAILCGMLSGFWGFIAAVVIGMLMPTQLVQVGSDALVGVSTTDGTLRGTFVYVHRNIDMIVTTVYLKNDDGSFTAIDLPPNQAMISDKNNLHNEGQLLTYEHICVAPWDKWTLSTSTTYVLRVPKGSVLNGCKLPQEK